MKKKYMTPDFCQIPVGKDIIMSSSESGSSSLSSLGMGDEMVEVW